MRPECQSELSAKEKIEPPRARLYGQLFADIRVYTYMCVYMFNGQDVAAREIVIVKKNFKNCMASAGLAWGCGLYSVLQFRALNEWNVMTNGTWFTIGKPVNYNYYLTYFESVVSA